ncbi:MAG TPA: S24 family peptidase [Candidatus Saccharimonadales bacterium]|nr:S24 family peptidase [Candidatus Saccharimonadales bacterium]
MDDNETYVYQDAESSGPDRSGVSVHSGFPNPAADHITSDDRGMAMSLNRLLIRNPSSTFFFRLRGRSWQEQGIFDGDIAVIDRAVRPKPNDLIVAWHETGFNVSRYKDAPLHTTDFGVVTSIIHQYER